MTALFVREAHGRTSGLFGIGAFPFVISVLRVGDLLAAVVAEENGGGDRAAVNHLQRHGWFPPLVGCRNAQASCSARTSAAFQKAFFMEAGLTLSPSASK